MADPITGAAAARTEAVLTDAQLAEIEARANAAMPGEWRITTPREGISCFEDGRLLWGACGDPATEDGIGQCFGDVSNMDAANAEFIAHARTDVPALLATLRAQAERVAALEQERDEARAGWRAAAKSAADAMSDAMHLRDEARAARAAAERSEGDWRFVRERAGEVNDDGRALMEAAQDWEMAARADGFGFAAGTERARIAAVSAREAFRRKLHDDCLPQIADVVLLARSALAASQRRAGSRAATEGGA